MKIKQVLTATGYTGFYFDDQAAIKQGAVMDGFMYLGDPVTANFTAIRQPGEALSIMLILEDGSIAYGDCAAVQYSGTGGRDPLFIAKDFETFFNDHIKNALIGLNVSKFRKNATYFDHLHIDGVRLHTALRYGITQALLDATAKANQMTIAEIVRKEYKIRSKKYSPVPIFAQTGDERYTNVDKMIIKSIDVLPHALINNIETKLGNDGEILKEYVNWLTNRVIQKRTNPAYHPIFHIDVYGLLGVIFNQNIKKIFDYLKALSEIAKPFLLRIEGPVDKGNRTETMEALRDLTAMIDADETVHVEIVADEWCNTYEDVQYFTENKAGHMIQVKTPDLGGVNNIIEALRYCLMNNMGAYSGGTCNETNISAEITTSIAIACQAKQVLAKPGMGADEGIMIVKNHMMRQLALINERQSK